jgi:hypothetical protein
MFNLVLLLINFAFLFINASNFVQTSDAFLAFLSLVGIVFNVLAVSLCFKPALAYVRGK